MIHAEHPRRAGWDDHPADECWSITGETILRDIGFFRCHGRACKACKVVVVVQMLVGCWTRNAGVQCLHFGFTFIFISGLSRFILSSYPFIYSFFFLLYIGKWASSILGGPVYTLPSISTSLPISPFYTITKEFFSKMAPNLDFRRSRPKITVDLANQKPNLVNSYTTGDRIDGTATISVDHDIRFDDIDITFEGISLFEF